jgi:signal transduction histidine kinase/pSer/pThr/pTyr-binding forkhead associated (FHA) protein
VPDTAEQCAGCGASLRLALLEVIRGSAPERIHFLKPRTHSLGRARQNDLCLTEPSVSKFHALILYQNDRFAIEDKHSLHGIYVNAVKVERAELISGCEIQLGNITLRFTRLDAEQSTAEVGLFPWVEQQQLLLSLVQGLNATLVLSQVLEQVLDAALDLTRAERAFLLLADNPNDGAAPEAVSGLRVRLGRTRDGAGLTTELDKLATAFVRRALERGETFASGLATGETSSGPTLSALEARSAVCIPMTSPRAPAQPEPHKATCLGALYLENIESGAPFGLTSLRATEALARHAALAIENAQLFEREQRTIDELRQAQNQLLHSEKLATIGMMATGIAHELNTPLTYILGNLELMYMQDANSGQKDVLDAISKGAQRLKALAQNLLLFARPSQEKPVPICPNEVIERSLDLCRYQILKGGVSVEKALATPLPQILGVPSQLEMAIINLVINAVQAMERGGKLALTSRAADSAVEITVSDTGTGIPEELQARIFEPFVTTKPAGQGTGLGLSTTMLVVERHAGKIDFTTAAGRGTTFRLTLPVAPRPSPNEP